MKSFITISFLTLILVSCNGLDKKASKFEKILESSTGQDQSVAKLWTEKGQYVVYKNEVTGEYTAYNLEKFDKKMKSYEAYASAVSANDVVQNLLQDKEWVVSGHYYEYSTDSTSCDADNNCYTTTSYYTTDEWIDTSHWNVFYTGGGFRFENNSIQTRDLDTLGALREDATLALMSHELTSQFSLSANRAQELAKLALRYQKLESRRELTSSEKNSFALESLGVSFTKVESAVKAKRNGSEAEYKKLLDEASQHNRTTPEEIGRFFEEFISEEI